MISIPKLRLFKSGLFFVSCFLLGTLANEINLKESPCPHNWVDATFVDLGCLPWEQANIYCHEENATLIEILTEEQLDFVRMELFSL